jgi:hypothetical protein
VTHFVLRVSVAEKTSALPLFDGAEQCLTQSQWVLGSEDAILEPFRVYNEILAHVSTLCLEFRVCDEASSE